MLKTLRDDSGSALVVALLMLIMLSFIGIAAISTSVRDMDIAKNTTDRTKAFYVAESGLEAAYAVLKSYPNIFGNDTLLGLMAPYTSLPNGSCSITLTGTVPYKTATSVGTASDGQAAVQGQFKRTHSALNIWNNAEPYQDDNGNNLYDGTLTATDLAADLGGTAGMYNNYSGLPASIESRIPQLDQDYFGG